MQLLKNVWSNFGTAPSVSRQRKTCKFANALASINMGVTNCTACNVISASRASVKICLKPVFTLYMLPSLFAALRACRVAMNPRQVVWFVLRCMAVLVKRGDNDRSSTGKTIQAPYHPPDECCDSVDNQCSICGPATRIGRGVRNQRQWREQLFRQVCKHQERA